MVYSSTHTDALDKKVTLQTLTKRKAEQIKFVTVALYDAQMAAMAEKCGVEVVLVGDSLGMTVLGYDSTLPVTMDNMLYHIAAVKRGNQHSLILADLPFMAYATPEQALRNAALAMQAGAEMIKIEGGHWLAETVTMLTERGIPVCAHIGLTPQSVHKFGGFRVQGRSETGAQRLRDEAVALANAGADLLLMECVPEHLADQIVTTLSIPTIGIGAGRNTDAQVLVINDILGLTEQPPKFSKNFLAETGDIPSALRKFVADVKNHAFPEQTHIFS